MHNLVPSHLSAAGLLLWGALEARYIDNLCSRLADEAIPILEGYGCTIPDGNPLRLPGVLEVASDVESAWKLGNLEPAVAAQAAEIKARVNPFPTTIHISGYAANTGEGAWAAVIRQGLSSREISSAQVGTTHLRMQLSAALFALWELPAGSKVEIVTSAEYLSKGMNEWRVKWEQNGWENSEKKPVANADLWRLLIRAAEGHEVKWTWCREASGNTEADRAREVAVELTECLCYNSYQEAA